MFSLIHRHTNSQVGAHSCTYLGMEGKKYRKVDVDYKEKDRSGHGSSCKQIQSLMTKIERMVAGMAV